MRKLLLWDRKYTKIQFSGILSKCQADKRSIYILIDALEITNNGEVRYKTVNREVVPPNADQPSKTPSTTQTSKIRIILQNVILFTFK